MSDQPVLDQTPLNELLEIGGPELVQELADVFLSDTPQLIEAIQTALINEDWNALARASHSLKSSAFYLGAMALSDLSANLEREAKAQTSLAACRDLGVKTPTYFAEAKLALERARANFNA
jgi:HPt (histidine-containing phosphotransfer) domain-containing protein